ncbi:MAG: tetratricopeptide repeat protein, partial [Methanotrichaceae archaeon]
MVVEISNPWLVGIIGTCVGAILVWIAIEYKTKKPYKNIITILVKNASDLVEMGEVEKAMSIYDALLKEDPKLEPDIRGQVKFKQGVCYYNQSFSDEKEKKLKKAIQAYKDALDVCAPETKPLDHAQIQESLGTAYVTISSIQEMNTGAQSLEKSISAYKEALKLYTAENCSLESARTESDLGDAYSLLSQVKDAEENLKNAIQSYEVALKFTTEKKELQNRAHIQNNLGLAYVALSSFQEDDKKVENLEQAIRSYEEALKVMTLEDFPTDYAEIQNNLGVAYKNLS